MKKRILCLVLAFLLLGTLIPAVSAEGETRAPQEDKLIALTFDDGPGKDTQRLLDGLRRLGAKCTFFQVGQYVNMYPDVVRQCYEDGHQMASHSWKHDYLTSLSDSQIREDLRKTSEAVEKAVGCKLTLMVRPPYGGYNDRVLNALGVPAFYWSDDSGDWWQGATADSVYRNTMKTAGDGDILLLHDSHSWSVTAALRIVADLQAQGYEFVTLSELFRRRGVKLEAGHIYSYLRQNGTNLPGISRPEISAAPTPDGMKITMQADEGTEIRYTLDGSVPRSDSPLYTGPFHVTEACTVTAVAGYDMNGSRSGRASVSVPKMRACDAPVITADGSFVTITAADRIYYTADGSEPSLDSPVYTGGFSVSPGTVIRAFAYNGASDCVASRTVSLYYSENGNPFDDVFPGIWYTQSVDGAVSLGLMSGTAPQHFEPLGNASRAMLVSVLYRMAGSPDCPDSGFPDVVKGSWYEKAVSWAVSEKIAAGFDDGRMHPDDTVTREQAAVLLERFAAYTDCDTRAVTANLSTYRDCARISPYAADGLSWAVGAGLFCGNGWNDLCPGDPISRAELASVLVRYAEKSGSWKKVHLSGTELRALADEVLGRIAEKDYLGLTQYLNPGEGLTFSPYSYVSGSDFTVMRWELIYRSKTVCPYLWGSWDGSGEEIRLTFAEYWDRFVWNTDFTKADVVTLNGTGISGSAIENVEEAYGDCLYVEYGVSSTEGYNDGTDWATLKLVFRRFEGDWYLTGLIHGEWGC